MTPLQKLLLPRIRLLGITPIPSDFMVNRYEVKYIHEGRTRPVLVTVYAKDELEVYVKFEKSCRVRGYLLTEDNNVS